MTEASASALKKRKKTFKRQFETLIKTPPTVSAILVILEQKYLEVY